MRDAETYTNMAICKMFSENSKGKKHTESLLQLRKGRNLELYKQNLVNKKKPPQEICTPIPQTTSNDMTENYSIVKNITNIVVDDESIQEYMDILKSQLLNAGIQPITEIISYDVAKDKLKAALIKAYDDDSNDTMKELERWDNFVKNHPKYTEEKKEEARQWKEAQAPLNLKALQTQRKIIPSDIFDGVSIQSLIDKNIRKDLAIRLIRNRCLWLVHMDMSQILQIHVADLRFAYSFTGLDIVEMRALFACMPEEFDNDPTQQKALWLADLKQRLCDMLAQEKNNTLPKRLIRNPAYTENVSKIAPKKIITSTKPSLDFMTELKSKFK